MMRVSQGSSEDHVSRMESLIVSVRAIRCPMSDELARAQVAGICEEFLAHYTLVSAMEAQGMELVSMAACDAGEPEVPPVTVNNN